MVVVDDDVDVVGVVECGSVVVVCGVVKFLGG